jgi:putative ABC transport system permease protein
MNLLQLVLKQMRQRALSTWLTLLSVLLGVGLAIAIMIIRRQGAAIFGQTDYGYDVLIGAKGSPLQLVLNTVYHLDKSPGNIPYTLYEQLTHDRKYLGDVHTAVPFVVGDSYQNLPIVGVFPTLFDTPFTRVRDAIDGEQDAAASIKTAIGEKQPLSSDFDFAAQQSALHEKLESAIPMVANYVPSTAAILQKGLDEMDAATKQGDSLPTDGTSVPTDNGVIKALQTVADTLEPAEKALGDELGADPAWNLRTVGPLPYRPDRFLEVDQGRIFAEDRFEAVLGYDVAHLTNPPLKVGDSFKATHGFPAPGQIPDIHPSIWKVVGTLKQTHTAADRVVYIPLLTFYTIAEHGAGLVAQHALRTGGDANAAIKQMEQMEQKKKAAPGGELMQSTAAPPPAAPVDDDDVKHYTVDAQGRIHLDDSLPKDVWGLSGIMVRSRSPALVMGLMYDINNGEEAAAVNPASTMRQFFAIFLKPSTIVLQIIVGLTTIVAGVGILVSIYNSVSARLREIAILRALGATRVRILTLICVEAGLIGLIGGFLGLLAGHLLGFFGSAALNQTIGEGFDWVATDYWEWLYLLAVVVLAVLAGLVPAMKAYRTPVATNLTAT